jgi:hypothetical protein
MASSVAHITPEQKPVGWVEKPDIKKLISVFDFPAVYSTCDLF